MFGFRKQKTPDALALEAYPDVTKFYFGVHQELLRHGLRVEWATIDKGLYWSVTLATEAAAYLMHDYPEFRLDRFQRFRDRLIILAIREVHQILCPVRAHGASNEEKSFESYFPYALSCYEKVRDAHFGFSEVIAIMRGGNMQSYFELIAENGMKHICEYPGGDEAPTPEGRRRYESVIEVSKPVIAREAMQMQSRVRKLLTENLKGLSA